MKLNVQYVTPPTLMLLALALILSGTSIHAQLPKGGKKISDELLGLFFEDINYAVDGGLYAEMVQNRSFEYDPTEQPGWNPFSFWEYMEPGYSYGTISVQTNDPVHKNNPHYVVIDARFIGHYKAHKGKSGVGIKI